MSQPIKGTAPRDLNNKEHDGELRQQLSESQKERSENVMVVDLVRNDLSKVCIEGTVEVNELFGVYEFPQVYQMISTVSGVLRDGINFGEIIRATFPMGSMTGAPKKRVMELIEEYEKSRRGLFPAQSDTLVLKKILILMSLSEVFCIIRQNSTFHSR